MSHQARPAQDDGQEAASCCAARPGEGARVSLDELLRLGEQERLASAGRHRHAGRGRWLRRAWALTFQPSERPARRLVVVGLAIVGLLAVVGAFAPQAATEVCSTMMLVLANEFVLLVRQRRAMTAVAG
jgi:hypothetical protein